MGIYIAGMEMPDVEHGVRTINIYADGVVTNYAEKTIGKAVSVPPHGDLIDRKTAYDSLLNGMVMTGYQSRALDCINEFYVPTTIPAEEGE